MSHCYGFTVAMVTVNTGQPPTGADYPKDPKPNYADIRKQLKLVSKPVIVKHIVYLHGEPHVVWEDEEVEQMIINENLQFTVIGKFSYGWYDFHDFKQIIAKQCNLKAECNIRVLGSRTF